VGLRREITQGLLHRKVHRADSAGSRGGNIQLLGGKGVEVIEDLPALHGVEITLRPRTSVTAARRVPHGDALPIETHGDRITLRLPAFSCHQMIELSQVF
jgi:hypothetical protein